MRRHRPVSPQPGALHHSMLLLRALLLVLLALLPQTGRLGGRTAAQGEWQLKRHGTAGMHKGAGQGAEAGVHCWGCRTGAMTRTRRKNSSRRAMGSGVRRCRGRGQSRGGMAAAVGVGVRRRIAMRMGAGGGSRGRSFELGAIGGARLKGRVR